MKEVEVTTGWARPERPEISNLDGLLGYRHGQCCTKVSQTPEVRR